ncbi:MAG: hypothetical protein K2M73_10585 [Lachnospiraceae bacterium]|nr:hypothetical protein [Lachnospiraceae bacterium]
MKKIVVRNKSIATEEFALILAAEAVKGDGVYEYKEYTAKVTKENDEVLEIKVTGGF